MTDIKKKIRMSSNSAKELEKNLALVCLDTSASMTWYGGMPEKAGLAMTLVATELVSEPWKNRYMSFTTNPTWHRLPKGDITKDDIWNRFKVARTGPIGGSTNFAKLLDLLLNTLRRVKFHLKDVQRQLLFSQTCRLIRQIQVLVRHWYSLRAENSLSGYLFLL